MSVGLQSWARKYHRQFVGLTSRTVSRAVPLRAFVSGVRHNCSRVRNAIGQSRALLYPGRGRWDRISAGKVKALKHLTWALTAESSGDQRPLKLTALKLGPGLQGLWLTNRDGAEVEGTFCVPSTIFLKRPDHPMKSLAREDLRQIIFLLHVLTTKLLILSCFLSSKEVN